MIRGKTFVIVGVVLTAAMFFGAFAYGYMESGGQVEQRIDVCGIETYSVAITTDGSDVVHVAYHGTDDGLWAVKHAVRSDRHWEVSTVTVVSDHVSDLKIRADGSTVHITWCDRSGFSYARSSSEGFSHVAVSIENFYSGSLVVDSAGGVDALCTVQHQGSTYTWYEYQHWTVIAGVWTMVGTYDVSEQMRAPSVRELLVDDEKRLRAMIWLTSNATGLVTLASATVTDEGIEIDEESICTDSYVMIDAGLDSAGAVHLLLRETGEGAQFLHWSEGDADWVRESIDFAGDDSWGRGSLWISQTDDVYVVYSSYFRAFELKRCEVAKWTEEGWDTKTVGSGNAYSWDYPAIVVDSRGSYHVARFVVVTGAGGQYVTYVNSDTNELAIESMWSAALWTGLAAMIGWPIGYTTFRWYLRKKEELEKLQKFEVYKRRLRQGPR